MVVFGSALPSDFAYTVAPSGPPWSLGCFRAPLAALRWKWAKDRATFITVQLVRVSPSRKQKAAETTEGGRGSVRREKLVEHQSLLLLAAVRCVPN